MTFAQSTFEDGKDYIHKRDFSKAGNYKDEDYKNAWSPHPSKYVYADSTETTENNNGYVFRIPLSEISIENLKVIPAKSYIIVQSDKKTIFIRLAKRIRPKTMSMTIKWSMLVISVEKDIGRTIPTIPDFAQKLTGFA
ncbi:MAG: hypothetical protein V1859_06830 [archaeon]